MLKLTCPQVKEYPIRERHCKICKSQDIIIHQTIKREIKDSQIKEITLFRMRCKKCRYSFRVYPEGIKDYTGRSKRLIFMGIILYTAGLSYAKVTLFLEAFLSRRLESEVTIWRDIQSLGNKLRRNHFGIFKKREHVVAGIDGGYFKVAGSEVCILFSVDARDNSTIMFEAKNEDKIPEIKQFIATLKRNCNLLGVTTDDWELYKEPLEIKRVPHQVCLAHVKKNFKRHLKQLPRTIPARFTETVTTLIDNPTPQGILVLEEIIKDPYLRLKNTDSTKIREIIASLLRKWKQYTEFIHNPYLPNTNNHTERAVGRSKIRYHQTRGLKSHEGLLNFIAVTQIFGEHKFQLLQGYC
jgi:hypothetical protein